MKQVLSKMITLYKDNKEEWVTELGKLKGEYDFKQEGKVILYIY